MKLFAITWIMSWTGGQSDIWKEMQTDRLRGSDIARAIESFDVSYSYGSMIPNNYK